MAVDLFAGIPVSDHERAPAWYERLLGATPASLPDGVEAVWELAEHRYLDTDLRPAHAGHAVHTLFADDLDAWVGGIAARGIETAERGTYANGVRMVTYPRTATRSRRPRGDRHRVAPPGHRPGAPPGRHRDHAAPAQRLRPAPA
ncbi:hypothetical protein LY71_10474 [Geodermatophilus tzadiensis]|uniref:VOC domain-containing protein n=1 Tax=Geodermatophilus tzadiensis TaxID=1137988 RepID=A0A2T0TWZ6_9ACTN|nr:hypothetical protein [Geodermatophilus tzadiensis]PRY50038.1 hypothetical protein LY71_10474 [Geodermatophilus tzadiensis]